MCMLHGALADHVESGESSSERVTKPKSERVARRFQHYELLVGEDGRPIELGRGAMGVTYKAFDVDLRCPVTLKVISEKHLGDESARLRFLREERAAEGIPSIANGIENYRATGSTMTMPFLLALKAEALYLAHRNSEALGAIDEAKDLEGVGGVPNCSGFAVYFWRRLVQARPKSKLRSAQPSGPQESKSRLR